MTTYILYTTATARTYQTRADAIASNWSKTKGRGEVEIIVKQVRPKNPKLVKDSDGDTVITNSVINIFVIVRLLVIHKTLELTKTSIPLSHRLSVTADPELWEITVITVTRSINMATDIPSLALTGSKLKKSAVIYLSRKLSTEPLPVNKALVAVIKFAKKYI